MPPLPPYCAPGAKYTTNKESACRIACILRQQSSAKRWFVNVTMTSKCDFINNAHLVTMITIGLCNLKNALLMIRTHKSLCEYGQRFLPIQCTPERWYEYLKQCFGFSVNVLSHAKQFWKHVSSPLFHFQRVFLTIWCLALLRQTHFCKINKTCFMKLTTKIPKFALCCILSRYQTTGFCFHELQKFELVYICL